MGTAITEREFSAEQRKNMAAKGQAMRGGGFPIASAQDLKNAIRAIGRAKNPVQAKRHIIRRARALGLTRLLPKGWLSGGEMAESAKSTVKEARVKGSTDDQLNAIRSAFREKYPDKRGPADEWMPGPWVRDVFLADGYLVCEDKGACYKVTFKAADDAVTFAEPADWKEVYLAYQAVGEAKRAAWVESAKVRTGYFFERVDLRESELDAAGFVAKGVTLIRPGFSANTDRQGRPRYYPAETLKAAAGLFEGVKAFANHPRRSDAKELPERSVRDITGYYKNVTASADGALRADFHVVGEARGWLWPLITEAVASKPDLVELSINALGVTKIGEAQGRPAVMVESIVRANSVDVVTTGAAGGTFAGALLAADGESFTRDLLAALSFEEWRAARPDFVTKLKGEWRTVREAEALKEARAEAEKARKELAAAQTQHRATLAELATYRRGEVADRLLAESKLPFRVRAEVRPDLLEAGDEPAMRRLVERETKRYRSAPKPAVPVAGGGQKPVRSAEQAPAAKPREAVLLGLDEAILARPGENAEQYRARRLAEAQTK